MNHKNYKVLSGEEVKIINGVFKGLYGYPEQIEMSIGENSLIHIRIDKYNVIKVNFTDVEFLYDDYLVYRLKCLGEPKVDEVIGKVRMRKDKVEDFLLQNYNSKDYPFISICAVPMDKVEFKFQDKILTVEEIKKIVN